jgi:hypothetical protein
MRRLSAVVCLFPLFFAIANVDARAQQNQFQVITGKDFEGAVPGQFYLEGQAIPVQKRNAALIETPGEVRTLFALLDTSGYGTDVTEKYKGMIITEGGLSIGGNALPVGSYGLGVKAAGATADAPKTFVVYNQAGAKVFECPASRDTELKRPRPLQVIAGKAGAARLYLERDWVELQ